MIRDNISRRYSGKLGDVVDRTMKDYGFTRLEQFCTREPMWIKKGEGGSTEAFSNAAAMMMHARIADNYNDGFDAGLEHCLKIIKNSNGTKEEIMGIIEECLRMD